ncbi:MAG: hypothetical protein AAGA66_21675 [Bacteroidota bacterium]
MSQEKEYWDLLEDYASEKLDADVRIAVDEWLSKNEDARTTLVGIESLMEELTDQQEMDRFHQHLVDEIISDHAKEKQGRTASIKWYWVAASLLVMVTGISYFSRDGNDTIEKKLSLYLSDPYDLSDQVRSNTSSSSSWKDAYKNFDFERVIALLSKEAPLMPFEKLYLGLSYLYTGQSESAIAILKTPFNNPYLDPQRKWFLSLTYLKTGQNERARPLLEGLAKNQSFKTLETRELLKLLDPPLSSN